jgi:energy-coupling factor transporter ATP-binding protein EcfA2
MVSSAMPQVTFDHVTFTYPEAAAPALSDVSLGIEAGQFTLVIGPSGSGKSTLLRCINGLVPHFSGGKFSGRVTVDGLDTREHPPRNMASVVGFVFQDPEAQFVTERVEDELAFALENAGVPQLTMRKRVEEVLDALGIASLRNRAVSSLSGGEQQRVAIAAALALQPKLLVLDEPTSQLDPQSAEDVLSALVRLNADLGLTIVLAEHRLERVLQYADRAIFLPEAGGAPLVGDPRGVMESVALTPPLVTVGKALGWKPLPLTIKEGRRFASQSRIPVRGWSGEREALSASLRPPTSDIRSLALDVRDVWYADNGQDILHGVSLKANAGEFVALMGRNGSGKTTLCKSIVGLARPQRGQVNVNGQDVRDKSTAEICRQVGYVPQNPGALLFADAVRDELLVTLRNHGLDEASAPVAPGELLSTLGLEQAALQYPRDLSTGQRQRTALASVLVTRPSILLLDEPTRGLDYAAKSTLVNILKRWQAQGAVIVMVTHDVELVATCADRVALMAEGEIVVDGPVRQVLSESAIFSSQINKLFGSPSLLTVNDVLVNLPKV